MIFLLILLILIGWANLGVMVAKAVGAFPTSSPKLGVKVKSCHWHKGAYCIQFDNGTYWVGHANTWWDQRAVNAPPKMTRALRSVQQMVEAGIAVDGVQV